MVSVSVRYLFYQPMDKKIKTIVLQYDVKSKYRLICRKFSGMPFFHPGVRLTKSYARLCTFDKPIKSLHFPSFVVSVLFARFHFKVIRKSL